MNINIDIDDHLLKEAFYYAGDITTKKELIETALREFIKMRKRKNLHDLKGRIQFYQKYDYKRMRED